MGNDLFTTSTTAGNRESTTHYALGKLSKELADQAHSGTDLQALDEKVKSMMGKCQRRFPMVANKKMERQYRQDHLFANCVAKKAFGCK